MKKIELITTTSKDISISQVTGIDDSEEYYLIGDDKALVCNDSNYRVSRISELSNRLKLRDWNVTNRRFSFDEENSLPGKLQICIENYSKGSGIVNEISKELKNITIDKYELTEEEETEFNNYLKYLENNNEYLKEIYNLYNNMNSSEIYLYSTSKNVVDILNDSITIDVIPYNSDIYTNTLDLVDIMNYYISSEISAKIDLGIQYSKLEMRYEKDQDNELIMVSEEKLYSRETTFSINSSYNQEGKLIQSDYIEEIGTDIVIEYINNVIRVIPRSINIDECIISNCTITYGKL